MLGFAVRIEREERNLDRIGHQRGARLWRKCQPVSVYPFEGIWLDIGRPEDYARAQELYAANPKAFIHD